MGFSNYLIKIIGQGQYATNYVVPMECISFESYKATYSALDKDSKRNGNGHLIRTVLPHKVAHCSVEMRPLSNSQIGTIMGNIQSRYIEGKELEKKVVAEVWIQEIDDYVQAEFYVPDIEFTIKRIENGKVFYKPFTLEFIGY